MFFLSFLLFQTVQSGLINPGTPGEVPHSFDCAVRQFAWEYGTKLLPRKGAFSDLRDALQVDTCNTPGGDSPKYGFNTTRQPIRSLDYKRKHGHQHQRSLQDADPSAPCTFYVDSNSGSDSNDGSINSPLATIPTAVTKTRQYRNNNPSAFFCTIYLRRGTYYLSETLTLLSVDSNLLISNYKTEQVSITGARSLKNIQWSEYKREPLRNKTYQNRNNVYGRAVAGGDNLDTTFLGVFKSAQQCQDASFSSNKGPFYSWTWHDTQFTANKAFTGQCFGIRSRIFAPAYEQNVWSGTAEFSNIWMTSLKENSNMFERDGILYGLRVNGKRGIRARFPNGDPETAMQYYATQTWIVLQTKWKPPLPKPPATDIIISPNEWPGVEWPLTDPGGDDTWTGEGDFGLYYTGLGGTCDDVEPPYGYWCSNHAPRGIIPHKHPSGLYYDQTLLPNTPYAKAKGAIIHAWRPYHWYTVQFEVGNDDGSMFEFSRGGFQGGEGFSEGAEWFIENVLEELDSPNEWFYDKETNILFYFHNDTNLKPPSNMEFSIPTTKILINMQASQVDPIKNVKISGITFKDTAYTYMDTHGLPSGGDWALERMGAILMEGAVGVVIDDCTFTRLDGNAVFLSGYNRYVNISSNDFEYLGANAMAAWGYTGGNDTLPRGVGPDGRSGDQPRFTRVEGNVVKEIGIWQKQSSMWFQAVSCQNLVKGNVFFNGPRAAINYNDGFGGGGVIQDNLLVNTCRESGDHGPFNGWDRVPYITNVRTGKPSVIPAISVIRRNFMMSTYQAYVNVDADDGTSYLDQTENFFVYGDFGLKSDFGGHDHRDFGNIHAYVGNAWGSGFSLPAGMQDAFYNNTVILRDHAGYASSCTGTYGFNDSTIYGNRVFNDNGQLNVCNTTLKQWVSQGHDKGTTVSTRPSDAQVIQWGKALLGM